MGDPIDIAALARQGVAVIAAARDEEHRPEVSRAWGPSLSDDGARLELCVEGAPDSTMARNLEAGNPLAVMLHLLSSFASVQLKGAVLEVGAPTQDRLDAVAEHVDRFIAETGELGVPEILARGLIGSDLVAVTMEVAERFDETPGSGGGRSL